jgi:transcription initiation factor TFIID subunit 1
MGQTGPQEYIEQLDMVVNHILVNDPMSIVTLREFYRPKLPLTIVRTTLSWQFCIRHIPGRTKKGGPGNPKTGDTTNATSYQALMMGNQPGALSKAKLRTESDLTPTEGDLVLLEYSEERPPIQLGPGMASKIVTYYRGDKSKCPVSRGGGDRPVRRKRVGPDAGLDKKKVANGNATDVDKAEKPPRLVGPNLQTSITDWVGKAPKRSKDDRKNEMDNLDVLPEGVTEILHPKARGPFLGEISDGEAVTGLITNMFVAPIFQHTAESTDFLMILGRNAGASAAGRQDTLKVVLREMPTSIFTVGQTEPRSKVLAPSTQSEKVFVQNWSSYQIAKFLAAADTKRQNVTLNALHSHFNSIEKGVLRTRIKAVANYDKPNNLYTLKRLGEDGFVGVDRMGRTAPINPENVVSYHAMLSFLERLKDLGMEKIFNGQHAVSTVEMAFAYLAAQANTAKDLARKLKKHIETVKMKKGSPLQLQFYENAAAEADALSRTLNRKKIVAKFIYDELQVSFSLAVKRNVFHSN